jgi:hypothetical protein
MSLFSRKPRDVSEVLLRLAGQLESAAGDLRRLAGQEAKPTPEPGDELDAVVIDLRHLEETEAEFSRAAESAKLRA